MKRRLVALHRLNPIFRFVAAQSDAKSHKHDETERTKIHKQSRQCERKLSRWCGAKKEIKTLRKQSSNRIPAHRRHQSITEWPRAERWLATERNGKNRQPRDEQRGIDNPRRETREQGRVKGQLS